MTSHSEHNQLSPINSKPIDKSVPYELLKQAFQQKLDSTELITIRAMSINSKTKNPSQIPLNEITNHLILEEQPTIIQISMLIESDDTEALLVQAALEELKKDSIEKRIAFKKEYRDKAKQAYEQAQKDLEEEERKLLEES